MSTVGALVDRVFNDALGRPESEPTQTTLTTTIDDAATTVAYDPFALPEEEALLGGGVIIEIGLELMRVVSVDAAAGTMVVIRGVRGSAAAAHTAGDVIYLAPKHSRWSVFDAVSESIVGLYPDLWHVATEDVDPTLLTQITDTNAVSVVGAMYLEGDSWYPVAARIVPILNGETEGVAVTLGAEACDNQTYIQYRAKFSPPTDEATTLVSLGVDPSWDRLIIVDTVAYLVAMPGPDAIGSHFITDALQEVAKAPNEEQSLAVSLVRLRQIYVNRHRKALLGQNGINVQVRAAY